MTNSESQNKRVLIVEDEPAAREASSSYLGKRGFDVAAAGNISDALAQAAEQAPDVLVCDWDLGSGENGTDVARKLQRRYRIPVILVTAHPLESLRKATTDIDVLRYMRKPLNLASLAATISDAVA
jgi:DNA-binding response OmpR family regulator